MGPGDDVHPAPPPPPSCPRAPGAARRLAAARTWALAAWAACVAAPAWGQDAALARREVPPVGWDGAAPVDLLVCLHGSGGDEDEFHRGLSVAAPAARRFYRVYLRSPDRQGWPRDAAGSIAAVPSDVAARVAVRGRYLLGYSAGGNAATEVLRAAPAAFDGVLVLGAIGGRLPLVAPDAHAARLAWVVGDDDPHVPADRLALLREHLAAGGYGPERARVDVVAKLGHGVDAAATARALDWLRAGLAARTPVPEAAAGGLARAAELVADDGDDELARLVSEVERSPSAAARATLAAALRAGLADRAPKKVARAARALGRVGDAGEADGEALAKLLARAREQPLALAAVEALGALGGEAARAALVAQLRRAAVAPEVAVACAQALARCGDADDLDDLIDLLERAEKRGPPALAAGIEDALRAITGQEVRGGRMWKAWRRAQRRAAR